jgi:sugar phosphate permease
MILKSISTGSRLSKQQLIVVITAFLSLLAIVGFVIYGLPFFYDFYIKDFGWTRATVTSGNFLGKLLVAPLFGFIAGWLIDKYGPKKMMMAGILMTAAAFIGLSSMNSLSLFYVSYIFIALGYVFGGPLPAQVLISRWFTKNRGKAMGIAYLGIGTGGALVPLISARLINDHGWQNALTILAIVIVLVALPLTFFTKNSPSSGDNGNIVTSDNTTVEKTNGRNTVSNILKNPDFYLLAFGSMCSIGAVGGINQHLKLYLRDLSFDQTSAAGIISLVLFMSLAGRILMGWLADIFPRKLVMILIYMIVALSIPLLLIPDFPGRLYIFAVIFGIGLGGDYMIIPLMAADIFGVKVLGRVMGIVLVADGMAESLFPVLVGRLYDNFESYTIGFILLIVLALAGAIIVSFLPGKPREN